MVTNLQNYEIILINDGSTDLSHEICIKYLEKYPNIIRYINNDNRGCSYSRNYGIKISTGEYISFIDSDDFVDENYYGDLYNYAKSNKLDVAIGGIRYLEKDENILSEISVIKLKKKEDLMKNFSVFNCPWNKVFRRDLIIKNNIQFPEKIHMGEDMAFMYQVYIKSKNIKGIKNELKYNYLKNESSVSFNLSKRKEIYLAFKFLIELEFLDMKLFNELFIRNAIYIPLKMVEKNKQYREEYLKEIELFSKFFNIKTKLFLFFYKHLIFFSLL